MNTFKVGDRVGYNTAASNYADYTRLGLTGTVSGISSRGLYVKWDDGKLKHHSSRHLVSFEPMDDPLPPAPESGLYFSHSNARVATLKLEPDSVAIGVTGTNLKVRLTPETALVMAHDLRRMAMELKRKQKQEAE